jgi:hypothetical protein
MYHLITYLIFTDVSTMDRAVPEKLAHLGKSELHVRHTFQCTIWRRVKVEYL